MPLNNTTWIKKDKVNFRRLFAIYRYFKVGFSDPIMETLSVINIISLCVHVYTAIPVVEPTKVVILPSSTPPPVVTPTSMPTKPPDVGANTILVTLSGYTVDKVSYYSNAHSILWQ